jgi:hypothetical protein
MARRVTPQPPFGRPTTLSPVDTPPPSIEPDRPAQPAAPAGPAGQTAAAPAGGSADRVVVPRERRLRLLLAVATGVVALLCLGGVGIGVTLYDRVTKIDRGSPDAAAAQYLTALLVRRDSQRASLLTCPNADVSQARALLDEMTRRERDLNVGISVNIENLVVSQRTDATAHVSADVRRSATVDGVGQSLVDRLLMTVRDQGGWRVCSVTVVKQ